VTTTLDVERLERNAAGHGGLPVPFFDHHIGSQRRNARRGAMPGDFPGRPILR